MTELLIYLAISALGLSAFIVRDAINAFDKNPLTPTLSSKIKAWRKRGFVGGRSLLISGVIFQGIFVLAYLFGHLVLEIW